MKIKYENKNTEIEELTVNFYPKFQCPLNIEPVKTREVDGLIKDWGKPCRSDCLWQGSKGFEEVPICKFIEYLARICMKH
jgi:hypothetical protein